MAVLQLQLNEQFYLRDPQETQLGRKIIDVSIAMIDSKGFENFTFKKLADAIDSTEASIYRYFENKHRLLVYLIAWYWNWIEYKIDFITQNIHDPFQKLDLVIRLATEKKERDPFFPDVDEEALFRIVINESDKTYLTRQVDNDNKEGLFRGYKSLCKKVASIISEINPDYKYPHSLASTVMQAAHQQLFFAKHLPSLTNLNEDGVTQYQKNYNYLHELVMNTISKKA